MQMHTTIQVSWFWPGQECKASPSSVATPQISSMCKRINVPNGMDVNDLICMRVR